MFNICMRMTGNFENARDVLQESFVLGFQNLKQLKDPGKFSGWLKKIVIHECIKHSKTRYPSFELDLKTEEVEDDEGDDWFAALNFEELEIAIEELPEGYRQVFTLYAVDDCSHKEIASLMGITESTSKSQYHRARQFLKKRLLKKLVS